MDDGTIDSPEQADNDDIGVDIDTLSIDGTRPKVGDNVDLKASGKITRIENNTAYVALETVNNSPIQKDNQSTDDQLNSLESQMRGMPLD